MLQQFAVCAALMVFLNACASSSEDVMASYVSPLNYQEYDCSQLAAEARRVSTRASQVAGVQDKNRTGDTVATTVGAIIFWPALFAIGGDNATTSELADLKGRMKAIEEASIQKRCVIEFRKSDTKSFPFQNALINA